MKRTLLFFALLLSSCAYAAGGVVNQFALPNGLKVLHMELTGNPLVTVQVFTQAGTVRETPDRAGLALFTLSLMTQGTVSRDPEHLATEIEDAGGNLSTDIEYDFCSMGISLMDSNFPKAMELLSDMLLHPSFADTEIEKERQNMLAGLKSRQDHIFYVANDHLNSLFYGTHPYSWPDGGKLETVARFTRQDLVDWHKNYFVADDMLMVIAGNIPLGKAKEMAAKYFSAVPAKKDGRVYPEVTPPAATRQSYPSRRFKQAYLMVAFPAPDVQSPDFHVLKIVNALLGSRMTGRLFTELREKQSLGYEVNSFYPSRVELSRFVVYLGLEKKNLAKARTGIFAILNDLKEKPVDAKELEETKNFVRGIYLLDHQTIGRQAWNTGFWEVLGRGYAYDGQYLDDLMSVTSADIQRVARTYFTDDSVQVEIVPE